MSCLYFKVIYLSVNFVLNISLVFISLIQTIFVADYLVLEQVCIAAFDCNRLDVAADCLQVLSSKFPGSVRIALLQVLHLEALERCPI